MNPYILKRPLITEKSMRLTQKNKFTFQVAKAASKGQIKQAVEDQFGVTVVKVNTIRVTGQSRRTGRLRKTVIKPSWKKAIVTLKSGQTIDLFESGEEKKSHKKSKARQKKEKSIEKKTTQK